MYKINISKTNDHFYVDIKITDGFKNIIKSFESKTFDSKSKRWMLPIGEIENYVSKIKEYVSESAINIASEDSIVSMSSDDDDDKENVKPRKQRTTKKTRDNKTKRKLFDEKDILITSNDKVINIHFKYCQDIIDAIKTIEGRKYESATQTWTLPVEKRGELYSKMKERGVGISELV